MNSKITLVKKAGIEIPFDYPYYNEIRMDLHRMVPGWNNTVSVVDFYTLLENKNMIIPRNYPVKDPVVDLSNEGKEISIKSHIVPRNDRQNKSIRFLVENTKGILKLEPGSGKTVIAIDSIAKIGRKAIIFVHKDKLRDQWKKELLTHTDIDEERIGFLSTATYHKDLEKDIVISTVQSFVAALKRRKTEFSKRFDEANFGVAVFDECHTTVGPEMFSLCSLNCNCRRVYGLSATPTRNDGNDDILFYHLGEVTYFEPEKEELLTPLVYMIYFPFQIYSRHKGYLHWNGRFDISRYLQQMVKSDHYISIVCTLLRKLVEKERKVLLLGNRLNALLRIAKESGLPREKVGIFIPTAISGPKNLEESYRKLEEITDSNKKIKKKKELDKFRKIREDLLSITDTLDLSEAFEEKDVVFSTYNACRDGNNRKELDSLIMTTPCSNVEQAAGRILRVLEGKRRPVIVDLVDTEGPLVRSVLDPSKKVGWFIKSAEKRQQFYKQKGWDIKVIQIPSNGVSR